MLTYITTSNLYWDRFELDSIKEMPFTDAEIEKCTVKKGDLLVCEGGDVGRSAIWHFDNEIRIQNHIHRLRSYVPLANRFYYYVFYLWKMQELIGGQGIGLQGLSSRALHKILVPLPSTNEQKNIVDKLDCIFDCISDLDVQKEDFLLLVDIVKSKILDLAIRGKLVPQDPNDEPASVLLERIRAEKEELIRQGKIKRDKKESVIFKGEDNSYYEKIGNQVTCIDSEIPFEIPENWAWSRLQGICEPITDGTHQTPVYSDSGYIFLSAKNVTTGSIDWNNIIHIPESLHKELYSRIAPKKGDILLAKNGTIGVAAIVDRDCEFDIYVTLALLRTVNQLVSPQYLLRAIGSATVQSFFEDTLIGIGVPNLHLVHIRQTLIPIPPLAEQERLANEVKKIFDILSNIKQSVS